MTSPYKCKSCGAEIYSFAKVVEYWGEIYCEKCNPDTQSYFNKQDISYHYKEFNRKSTHREQINSSERKNKSSFDTRTEETEKPNPEQFGLTEERVTYFESTQKYSEAMYVNIGLWIGFFIGLLISMHRDVSFLIIIGFGVFGAFSGYKYANHLEEEAEKTKKKQADYPNYMKYLTAKLEMIESELLLDQAAQKRERKERKRTEYLQPEQKRERKERKRTEVLQQSIATLPETSYIEVSNFKPNMKVDNPQELARFEQHKHLIKEIVIERNYPYKPENEAITYMQKNNLIAMRSGVIDGDKIFNIFFLSKYQGSDSEMLKAIKKYKEEINSINSYVKLKDIQQFSKYLIGIPDLFVIDKNHKKYFFCEVKSKFDRLQDSQKLWFLKNFIDNKPDSTYQLLRIHRIEEFITFQSNINGLRYHSTSDYLDNIKEDNKLLLQRDINNPHDDYAVKVIYAMDNKHIGFVPKDFNREKNIWKMLEEGRFIDCFVYRTKKNPAEYKNSHTITMTMRFKR